MPSMQRPQKPSNIEAPGLAWRPRATGWTAYWIARPDIAGRGYKPKSVRLWPPSEQLELQEPTPDEWATISSSCLVQQDRMLVWSHGGAAEWDPRAIYDGSVAALVRIFKDDPDSPYKKLRFHTQRHYDKRLSALKAAVGDARVPLLTFRDFRRWYEKARAPKEPGGALRKSRGHSFMTYVRIVIGFGSLLKLPGCKDAKDTLSEMEFENGKKRTKIITPAQVTAVIEKAAELGWHSIAWAQALQDGLIVRQKDIVGEWIPIAEPGLSDITARGQKWVVGVRWEEVSPALVLTHRLSKSLQGRDALADADAGKVKEFDLTKRPLVMALMERIPEDRRHGPMVICEYTGLPWRTKVFQEKWRKIARAAGVPDDVQNRDTRAGGITHGRKSGARLEDMRHAAGHSMIATTAGYDRDDLETDRVVAEFRAKNTPKTA